MRLRFLGTGTSSGVPTIGCNCAVCTSTDPRDQRTRTSATLEFTDAEGIDRVILIDASPDHRQQALDAKLERVDAILITHNHVDHVFGLDEVRRYNELMKQPIEVWADEHTHESLERVYMHIFQPHTNVQRSFIARLVPRTLTPFEPIELFGVTITPVPLLHGKLEILGFRIDAPELDPDGNLLPLGYCTDVSVMPNETLQRVTGVRTLVLDALRERPHFTHMTVGQAIGVAHEIGADRTYFVHMTHDLGHAETNAGLPDRVALAYDGLILPESG